MSQGYTLYIHDDSESLDSIDDDLPEPTAFQVPVDMEWNALQELILTEVGCETNMSFTYIDDESDIIQINSQDEYKIALDLCDSARRDLHIYSVKPNERHKKHRRRKKMPTKDIVKNKFSVVPPPDLDKQEDDVEIFRPPGQEEEIRIPLPRKSSTMDPPVYTEIDSISMPTNGNIGAAALTNPGPTSNKGAIPKLPHKHERLMLSQHEGQDSLESKNTGETVPMVVNDSIYRIIRKEVQEVVTEELNDIWRFVGILKRDINNELGIIGDQLTPSATRPSEIKTELEEVDDDIVQPPEAAATETSQLEPTATEDKTEDEPNNCAATFICESLLDGSIVHTGEEFEKHWVFRNDGDNSWDENTKLHLLDETFVPEASESSMSKWGAKNKSVIMPPLRQGESGVVCAEHVAPAHTCSYNSSWRLSHKDDSFGPRVWCNVNVVDPPTVDSKPFDSARNLESFEVVEGERSSRNSLEQKDDEVSQRSLVSQEKLEVEITSPKPDENLHNDNSILSFNMDDISDGAKYIETASYDEASHNPAITSVEHKQEEESLHHSLNEDENVGASVDVESDGTDSPVLVTPPQNSDQELEDDQEEPRTLENEEEIYEDAMATEQPVIPDHENEIDNFTEQVVTTPDPSSEDEKEEEEEVEEEKDIAHQYSCGSSEDLYSIDYNLVDDNLASYETNDFVVVPLPECFDVNKPLSVSQHEDFKEEKSPLADETREPEQTTENEIGAEVEEEARQPPSVGESFESEVESQPSSTTFIKEYKSEDSLPIAPKTTPTVSTENAPITPTPPSSPTLKINLVPTFQSREIEPQNGDEIHPDSADNESLTEKITKEFDAFLSNPQQPIEAPLRSPKVPMNQMISVRSKTAPAPKPVPSSVLNMDQPYCFDKPTDMSQYAPFDQGWRRNPIPLPRSVTNDTPWVLEHKKLPASINHETPWPTNLTPPVSGSNDGPLVAESTFPPQPFAVASPSLSYSDPQDFPEPPRRRRPRTPDIPLADDFYPPGGAGLNVYEDADDEFRTPPPSPPPRRIGDVELSPLDQLYEMGFHDLDLNNDIFDRCNRDLNRTVQALILRAQADEDLVA